MCADHVDEKNDKSKKLIRSKVNEYMTRAETLKQYVTERGESRRSVVGVDRVVSSGSGTTGRRYATQPMLSVLARLFCRFCRNDGGGDGECDPEINNLRASLANTTIADKSDIDWDAAHSEVTRIFSSAPDREQNLRSSASSQLPPATSGNLDVRAHRDPARSCN